MALDTKRKRGSVLEMTAPWRLWLAEPDGTLAVSDRQSLLKLASTPEAGTPVVPDPSTGDGIFRFRRLRR